MPTINDVTQARTDAAAQASTAAQQLAGTYNIESVLKQKLTDAYNANQDIIKPLDTATANYTTAPSVAREKYQDIFNPFSREKLVSQYTANQAIPMQTLSSILGQRQGSIADIINAGTGGYKAQATVAQNQAEQARASYEDIFKEYQFQQQQALEQQKLTVGEDPFIKLLRLQGKLKTFDPNATMVTTAQNADTVLKNIEDVRNATDEDLKVAAKIASSTGANGVAQINGFAKIFATPKQIQLANSLVNARNVIRLRFTGAAFSESERPDYAFMTGQDPILALLDPNNAAKTRQSITDLEAQFKEISKSGKNRYQGIIDQLDKSYFGTAGIPGMPDIGSGPPVPPNYKSTPGKIAENPVGSGTYWTGDENGGWN